MAKMAWAGLPTFGAFSEMNACGYKNIDICYKIWYDINLMILGYMLSLTSYEYVRSLVSLIIHLVSVSFAVSEYQLRFGLRTLRNEHQNLTCGYKNIDICWKVWYDINLMILGYMLSLMSYEHVRRSVSFIICLVLVSFSEFRSVSEFTGTGRNHSVDNRS